MIINMTSGGVVPERIIDAQTITPGTEDQAIAAGTYLRGALTILGDTDLIPEKLPNDVNLFGVQGTRKIKNGFNVWKKSQVIQPEVSVTNPTLTCVRTIDNSASNGIYVYTITCNDVDFTQLSDIPSFLEGFHYVWNPTPKLVINLGSLAYYDDAYHIYGMGNTPTSISQNTVVFNSDYGSGTGTLNMKYDGTKIVQSLVTSAIEFIVDDDPNAYPDGAVHTDGYYYELLGQVSSANIMSLSDNALATVQQDYRDTIETEVSNANS